MSAFARIHTEDVRKPFLMAVLTGVLMGLFGFGATAAHAQGRVITVMGRGVVSVAPDLAIISLGTTHRQDSPDLALEKLSEVSAALLEALEALGLSAADVKTNHLSLQPVQDRYDAPQPRIVAYEASQSFEVRVRDLDKLGAVITAVTEAGGNRLSGLRFSKQDVVSVRDQARSLAMADARRKAVLYAEAAGVALGEVQSISELSTGSAPQFEMRAMMSADMPVATGEMDIQQSVTVVYALGE